MFAPNTRATHDPITVFSSQAASVAHSDDVYDGDGERQASHPAWLPSESSCSQAASPPSARGASFVLASEAGFSVVLLL
ncbi:MAG: hypothetical protein ACPIOQ_55710 [Promethearchaeia archaeon]